MDESNHYLAEIIDHFDICAIQEIKTDLKPLKNLVRLLGPHWDYFVSDISTHKGGNSERMAFVYNAPFFASFQAGWFKFSLCSAHIIFGDDLSKRAAEIGIIAKSLIQRAEKEDQVHIFLGDMNIERQDDEVMAALKNSGLTVPEFGPTNMAGNRWFDQIAFTEKGKADRKTKLLRHGKFDWRHSVFGPHPSEPSIKFSQEEIASGKSRLDLKSNLDHYEQIVAETRRKNNKPPYQNWPNSYSGWTTHEMSDHLPIWIELEVDYSDDYLRRYLNT